jgi:ribosome-associated protein
VVRKLESYLADQQRIAQDDSDLTSRTDLRHDRLKAESHYMALAGRLCATSNKRLAKLELGEFLLELIGNVQRIDSPAARHRALRRVRKELRDVDMASIERKLDELDSPSSNVDNSREALWTKRLLDAGERALDDFVADYPSTDRGRLRTLIRNLSRTKEEERTKATKKLTLAIREYITLAPVDDQDNDQDDAQVTDDDSSR